MPGSYPGGAIGGASRRVRCPSSIVCTIQKTMNSNRSVASMASTPWCQVVRRHLATPRMAYEEIMAAAMPM